MKSLSLDGTSITLDDLWSVAYERRRVQLDPASKKRMQASRSLVEEWVAGREPIYGITTGFGEFSNVRIDSADAERLQENLILSHAVGAGDPIPPEVIRAMMALRVNALAKGFSGIRIPVVEQLVKMLNRNIIPVVPSQGSVGASGDLVPLSHLVLAMMGRGVVWQQEEAAHAIANHWFSATPHETLDSGRALKREHMKPVVLTSKEGLALINGTQMMSAYTGLAVHAARQLCKTADIAAGLSAEALRGSDTAYDERIHKLRPYTGQQRTARNLRRLMHGSPLREWHRYNDTRVQDAYSLRCVPQVHGASRDAVEYVHGILSIEINSANDNPLIFPKDRIHLEGGNFHGQPIALAADFLAIAMAELANISERRIERLVNGSLSGLPRFLTSKGGLNSGLMIAQYTAASIVSENKVLCHPGSVDSIPTSANQEDHNSMGSISSQKAWRVLKNAQRVLGIELMCAAQAFDFARMLKGGSPLKGGAGTEAAHAAIRRVIDPLNHDRFLYPDVQKGLELVVTGSVIDAVERRIGRLD